MAAEDRYAIFVETGGDLSKTRTFFRFGKKVEGIVCTNGTATTKKFDIQVARDNLFYVPPSPFNAQVTRREILQETYFYWSVAAGTSTTTPPFFADRGLRIPLQGAQGALCSAHPLVHGVQYGDCAKDLLGNP